MKKFFLLSFLLLKIIFSRIDISELETEKKEELSNIEKIINKSEDEGDFE